jgi:hypothetical protein
MSLPNQRFAFLVLLWIATGQLAVAQKQDQFLTQQKQRSAENPAGVSLQIQTRNNQTRFRQGEVISLQLSFSSNQPKKYHLDAATYDRSGRLDLDTFHVDPKTGTSDPLVDYFNFGFMFMGGGLRTYPSLESKSYVVKADLNEWCRFDRPGKYRLYVTSHRVSSGYFGDAENQTVEVTSNVIELEVVPADTAWSRQTLAAATSTMDSKNNSENRREACRVLRFLGTKQAVHELVKRFDRSDSDSGCEFEIDFGLRSTPHRALAVSEMENQLAAADFAVTDQFLRVLAFLSFLEQNGPPLPYISPNEGEEAIKLWRKEFDRRNEIYDEIFDTYRQRLLATVSTKAKRARAVSLETLLTTRGRDSKSAGKDEDRVTLKRALASIFSELPTATQENLLDFRWPEIAGEEMLPILRRLYETSANDAHVTSLALAHIYELSPDEGRRLILEEMGKDHPRVNFQTLSLLPDETLAEVDALIEEQAGNDSSDLELLLQLAERYASSAVAAKLKATYEEKIGRLACLPQEALLSYFVRVDPDSALGFVEKALASRKATGCYQTVLSHIASKHRSAELDRIAIATLDDSDVELVRDAVDTLGRYGSKEARDPLFHRFERWHEIWDGRQKELAEQQRDDILHAQVRVEEALLRALTNSPAWLADEEMVTKLRSLCVSRSCTSEADSILKQLGPNITIFFEMRNSKVAHTSIGQYNSLSWDQLKTKVIQYPKGTTFMFGSDRPNSSNEQSVFDELRGYLEKYEMKLKRFETDKGPE